MATENTDTVTGSLRCFWCISTPCSHPAEIRSWRQFGISYAVTEATLDLKEQSSVVVRKGNWENFNIFGACFCFMTYKYFVSNHRLAFKWNFIKFCKRKVKKGFIVKALTSEPMIARFLLTTVVTRVSYVYHPGIRTRVVQIVSQCLCDQRRFNLKEYFRTLKIVFEDSITNNSWVGEWFGEAIIPPLLKISIGAWETNIIIERVKNSDEFQRKELWNFLCKVWA